MITHLSKQLYQFNINNKKIKSLYQILNIPKTATLQQIKSSYYKLAKQYHPDTHQGNKSNTITDNFKLISQAYNILKDSEKRKQYDQQNFTTQGQKKQYKFYDQQHNYGYNAKTYRKNPYQSANPFQSSFQSQYKQNGSTNPYNSDFSQFYKSSNQSSTNQQQSSPNPNQSWQQYVRQQHRKNVAQNRKIAINRLKQSNTIIIIVLGVISVYIIGELTFKIYQFNSFYRIRSYPQKLDPRQLMEHQRQLRISGPRKDYY